MACTTDTISIAIDHNTQPASPSPSPRRRRCSLLLCGGLLGLLLLAFSATTLALWPNPPVVTLADATITNFNLSHSTQQLSADVYARFSFANPNRRTRIDHHSVHAAVTYSKGAGPPLYEVRVPSFHQPAGNSTMELEAKLVPRAAFLDSSVFQTVTRDIEGHGTTTFDVELSTRMSYRPWWWGLAGSTHILCQDVTIWFPHPDQVHNAGSTTGPETNCRVTRSWW